MYKVLSLISLLGLSLVSHATTVTATITDTDGQTWNNGAFSVTLVNPRPDITPSVNGVPLTPNQLQVKGFLNGSGVLSVILVDNTTISPVGTSWAFSICPDASAPCGSGNQAVAGVTQDLSSYLSSIIKAPRFGAFLGAYGYSDQEITIVPNNGAMYFNVTQGIRVCSLLLGVCTWSNVGGSGGSPGNPVNSTQYNNAGSFGGVPMEIWNVPLQTVFRPFNNYGGNDPNHQIHTADMTNCGSAQDEAIAAYTICDYTVDSFSDSGPGGSGQANVHLTLPYRYYIGGLSISQVFSGTFGNLVAHDQDSSADYKYDNYRNGVTAASDEGNTNQTHQAVEAPPPAGTIVTGGANAQIVKSNFTLNSGNQGVTSYLVDTSQLMSSGNLLVDNDSPGGNDLPFYTTSDTHTVSTGYGHTTAACGAVGVARNRPVSFTCPINLSTDGGFGAITPGYACIGDYHDPEVVQVTSVTGSSPSITIIYKGINNHSSTGIPVYQGGMCGALIALDEGRTDPFATYNSNWKRFTTYFAAGSRTGTTIDYVVVYKQGQNGIQKGTIPSNYALTLTGITSGGSGSFSAVAPGGVFNPTLSSFVASGAQAVQIVGSSGCSPTCDGPVTSQLLNVATNVLTWHGANITTSGSTGTMEVTGNNGYHAVCGAQTASIVNATPLIVNNDGTTSGHPWGDGSLGVTANVCNWNPGDAVVQPNHYAQEHNYAFITDYRETPNVNSHGEVNTRILSGPGWSGAVDDIVRTNDSLSSMSGYGGKQQGHSISHRADYTQNPYIFDWMPLSGSPLFTFTQLNPNDPFHSHSLIQMPGGANRTFGYDDTANKYFFGDGLTPTISYKGWDTDTGYQYSHTAPLGHILCGTGTFYTDCTAIPAVIPAGVCEGTGPVNARTCFHATGNAFWTSNGCAITSSTAILVCASGVTFTSADIGKTMYVAGAGSAGATLQTTVSGFTSGTTLTLGNNASTTVTNSAIFYATDDTTALQNAFAAAKIQARSLYIPGGTYLHHGLNFTGFDSRIFGDSAYAVTQLVAAAVTNPGHINSTAAVGVDISGSSRNMFDYINLWGGWQSGMGDLAPTINLLAARTTADFSIEHELSNDTFITFGAYDVFLYGYEQISFKDCLFEGDGGTQDGLLYISANNTPAFQSPYETFVSAPSSMTKVSVFGANTAFSGVGNHVVFDQGGGESNYTISIRDAFISLSGGGTWLSDTGGSALRSIELSNDYAEYQNCATCRMINITSPAWMWDIRSMQAYNTGGGTTVSSYTFAGGLLGSYMQADASGSTQPLLSAPSCQGSIINMGQQQPTASCQDYVMAPNVNTGGAVQAITNFAGVGNIPSSAVTRNGVGMGNNATNGTGEADFYNMFIGAGGFNFYQNTVGGYTLTGRLADDGMHISTSTTYWVGAAQGFTGTKTAGSCVLTITGGIITNVTGC